MKIYKSGKNSQNSQNPQPQYIQMEHHQNTQVEALLNSLKELTCNCSLLLSNWDTLQMRTTQLFIGKAYNMNA